MIRHEGDFSWRGVPLEPYKATTALWKGVTRHELSGKRGESQLFHVRYFEIEPGGHTSEEKHVHTHAIIGVRGRGVLSIGDDRIDVRAEALTALADACLALQAFPAPVVAAVHGACLGGGLDQPIREP